MDVYFVNWLGKDGLQSIHVPIELLYELRYSVGVKVIWLVSFMWKSGTKVYNFSYKYILITSA